MITTVDAPPTRLLRPLPRPVQPVHRETLDSYVRRLAYANRLDADELRAYAANDAHKRAPVPLDRLAALSDTTTTLLQQRIEEWRPVPEHPPARIWPPVPACALCMARRAIAGLVVVHREVEAVVCRKHGRWLDDTDGLTVRAQPNLRAHPEILAANVAHRRLIGRYGRRLTDATYMTAYDVSAAWRSRGEFDEHLRTLLWRFHPDAQHIRQSDPTVEAAAYPQVIAIMRMLTLPALRELPFTPGGTGRFVAELRRTAAPGYRWNLARAQGRGDPLINIYLAETRRRRDGHPPRPAGDPPSTAEMLREFAASDG